jgi:hypothetical protein
MAPAICAALPCVASQIFQTTYGKRGKGLQQQAEVAQRVPGKLKPRIFLTFGTTRVVGRQPYAPAALPQEKSLVLIFRG